MSVTKAEAAAIAYHAIHEQLEELTPYAGKLRFVIEVIEILKEMADTEHAQYIDSIPKSELKVVE